MALLIASASLPGCGEESSREPGRKPARLHLGDAQATANEPSAGRDISGGGKGIVTGTPSIDRRIAKAPRSGVSGAGACAGTNAEPNSADLAQVKTAILCLLNAERRSRGLPPLRASSVLASTATQHANDMVKRGYFSHNSPSGSTPLERIRRSGYLKGARLFRVGENMIWGTGSLAAAQQVVNGWMRSPPHRANILQPRFTEIGLGAALGTPSGSSSGATYVSNFGRR